MQSDHPVRLALKECRRSLWAAFFFGFFINMLMLAVPLYSLQVLDRVLSSGSLNTLMALTLIVAVALLFMGMMQALRSLVFAHIGRWLDDRLSSDIVTQTVTLAVHNSKIGSQPLRDLGTVRGFVTSPHLANLFDAPWAIIFFAVIYIINIWLGVIVTIGAVLLLGLAFLAHRIPSEAQSSAQDQQLQAMRSLDAIIRNAEVVKSMGLLARASARWQAHNAQWLSHSFNAGNLTTVMTQITRTLRLGLQVLVTGAGAYFAIAGTMSPGSVIAVSILSGRALAPCDAAAPLYQSLVGVQKALERLYELSKSFGNPDMGPNTGPNKGPDKANAETMVLPEAQGALVLEKLAYETSDPKHWIIRGINIEIAAGEAVGIIGPSGSGKTTLARLMVGVLEPSNGAVRLDGATLSQWDAEQLGTAIGYLPQSVELFAGTIAENIARLDPAASDEAVIEAAKRAHVHETILGFHKGYHTEIGANGSLLSAGQRQRVALARCFYGNPKLIVMDEPNANLDHEGEEAFARSLQEAKRLGITTLTIAHRPSVLQSVDKILVLQNGEAKLFGPAAEVMADLARANTSPLRKDAA